MSRTAPFVVAIGTRIFVPSEKLGSSQYAGLVIAFLGIVIAFGESLSFPSRRMLIGDSMLLLGAIFWGATTVVIKAVLIPPAIADASISPAASIESNASIIPNTVPKNPNIGANAMNNEIQETPFSINPI